MQGRCQPTMFAALFAALLAGCAASSDAYPSLAIRDAERSTAAIEQAPAEGFANVQPVASPQEIADLVSAARSSHRDFLDAQPGAVELVKAAQGQDVESNAYGKALVAISRLRSLRGQTLQSLGTLDGLDASAAISFAATADLRTAQAEVMQIISQQDEVLKLLRMEMNQ